MRRTDSQMAKRLFVGILCSIGLVASFARSAVADDAWPVKVQVDVNAESHNSHTVWLRDPKSPLSHLELRVTPLFNDADEVIGWDVELVKFSDQTGNPGPNLLAPKGNWHGWQSFMIRPTDLGESRRDIRRNGFRCTITVLGSETKSSRATPKLTVFESLRLQIELAVDQQKGKPAP